MSYADKKAKREQEIAGLKEALTILSADAFLQVSLQYMFDRLRKKGVLNDINVVQQKPRLCALSGLASTTAVTPLFSNINDL